MLNCTPCALVGPAPSYMDNAATLAPPIVFDARYDAGRAALSFSHSAYHVPNKGPGDIGTFSAAINNTLDRSAVLDPLVKRVFAAGYVFLR